MEKSKIGKIIRIVIIGILAAVGLFVIGVVCSLTDQPRQGIVSLRARQRACEYVKSKYGETLTVSRTSPNYTGGFMFDRGSLESVTVYPEGEDWLIYAGSDYITDSKQAEDISRDFTEKYLTDSELGSPCIPSDCSEPMYICGEYYSHGITAPVGAVLFNRDGLDRAGCFAEYYDGDIEAFLKKTAPEAVIFACYEGDPDKADEYREILHRKLSSLSDICGSLSANVIIYDPSEDRLDRPEIFRRIITCVYRSEKNEEKYFINRLPETEGHTAVYGASDGRPADLIPVDMSENTVAHASYINYDYGEENTHYPLRIRETAYKTDAPPYGGIYLRLEREHYGIDENTLPLLVTDILTHYARSDRSMSSEEWTGKRSYASIGVPPYAPARDSAYYLDSKYLYLFIDSMSVDLEDAYIAFADIDGTVNKPLPEPKKDGETE